MIRYLVDTDIVSYFLKKHDMALLARVRTALRANQVAISAVTRAELRYGQALLPAEAARRRALIDAFLADVPVLDRGARAADRVHGHQDRRPCPGRGSGPGHEQSG